MDTWNIPILGTRLGITPEAWEALHRDSRFTIRAACLRKKPYYSRNAALEVKSARDRRDRPDRVYPCPFVLDGPPHFHIGRVPTMKVVALIALAIRDLHHDRPIDLRDRKAPDEPPLEDRSPARA